MFQSLLLIVIYIYDINSLFFGLDTCGCPSVGNNPVAFSTTLINDIAILGKQQAIIYDNVGVTFPHLSVKIFHSNISPDLKKLHSNII